MAFTFIEFLKERDPIVYREFDKLGIDLSDKDTEQALLAQLQKQKVDMKAVAANVNANPQAKPDKAQLIANQKAQQQADMLAGKAVPTGVNPADWDKSVSLLTPTGNAVPNEIGRGKPKTDVASTLEKGAGQGGLPANVNSLTPPWLNMKSVKPPVSSTTPEIDSKKPMLPAEKAKAKAKPMV